MKLHDNGSFYSVSISADEVRAFKAQWPCSGMPEASLWVQFDKRNGDLVDMRPSNWEEKGADGSAMLALIGDAQEFALRKLNPPCGADSPCSCGLRDCSSCSGLTFDGERSSTY